MLDTVQRVPPEAMVREEEGELFVEYQARHLFIQTVDHGIEHRTNITTILSGLGLPAPEVDGWAYMWAHTERFGAREGKVADGK